MDVKLATLPDLHECQEGFPVELWLNEANRIVIRCRNEGGFNATDLDLYTLLEWVKNNFSKEQIYGAA